MSDEPRVVCERVMLRRLSPDDAPAMAAYRSDPDVARYQSWESYTLEQAEAMCERQALAAFGKPDTWFQFGIVRKADDVLIGDCGLHFAEEGDPQIELGVTLSAEAQGRGLASEAIAGVLDLAFLTLGVHRVTARTDAENGKAAAMFARLGFRRETHALQSAKFKGAWCDEFGFAMLRGEWMTGMLAGRAKVELGEQSDLR